jgi:uncharacterized coiled-coil protein SlyX
MTEDITAETATLEERQPEAPTPRSGPGLLGRIGRFLLRMLVVLILGIALGTGLFYGAIDLYRNTIEPLRTVDSRLVELEDKLKLQEETARAQVGELQDRTAALEGDLSTSAERISELDARLGVQRAELDQQQSEIAAMQAISDRLAGLTQDLDGLSARVVDLETLLSSEDLPTQRIKRDLQLLRVMALLTRARVSLNQVNLGLAQGDMLAARDILASIAVEEDVPGSPVQAPSITAALERLDAALASVLGNSTVAGEELEICWQYLLALTAPPEATLTGGTTE